MSNLLHFFQNVCQAPFSTPLLRPVRRRSIEALEDAQGAYQHAAARVGVEAPRARALIVRPSGDRAQLADDIDQRLKARLVEPA